MIKYAVMTFMYNGWVNGENGSHEELIKILSDSGADGIEAFANHFMGDDDVVKLYQREMKKRDLTMPIMDLLANLAVADKQQRHETYELMRQGIDICDALDAEIVHIAGCSLVEGVTAEEGRKWIAEGLSDFVADVEQRGMVLAFEDFDPSPTLICSAADCLSILKQSDPRVRFVFDTGNFEAAGEHAEDNFDQLFDYTCNFHFKDFAPNDTECGYGGTRFGTGMVKNREIAKKIIDSGYDGWVALESVKQYDSGPVDTIPKELEVLKSMF